MVAVVEEVEFPAFDGAIAMGPLWWSFRGRVEYCLPELLAAESVLLKR